MDKSKEKEAEFGLKNTRLRMLVASSEDIASGDHATARLWLLNFIDSIDPGDNSGIELMDIYLKLTEEYNKKTEDCDNYFDRASKGIDYDEDRCQGLPPMKWLERENAKNIKLYVRDLHRVCWKVGNKWDLIPKE